MAPRARDSDDQGGERAQRARFAFEADDELAQEVLRSTRRARGVELTAGVLGRPAGGSAREPRFPRLSRDASVALAAAGHRPETLAGLRLADLGAGAAKLTLADVDALHAEAIRAGYAGRVDLPDGVIGQLIDHRIPAWELLDLRGPCGFSLLEPPLVFERDPSLWENVDLSPVVELVEQLKTPFTDLGVVFPPPRDGEDWQVPFGGRDDFRGAADRVEPVTTNDVGALPYLDAGARERRVADLRPGEVLAAAQAADFRGDTQGARELLGAATSMEAETPVDAFQLQVLLPTLAAAITAPSRSSLAAARAAIEAAPPATPAATVAQRAAVRSAAAAARRASSAANLDGPGSRAGRALAADGAVDVITARYLDGLDVRPAVALESATALLDLHRAFAAAVATPRTRPVRLERGRPVYGENGAPDPMHVLRHGAGKHLADPTRLTHVFAAFLDLNVLCSPVRQRLNFVGTIVPFRFDWLLAEARHIVEDLGRVDALSIELVDMLWRAALERIEAQDAVRRQVDELVQQLVAQINRAAATLRDTVAAAVPRLRELGALQAIYDLLAAWPHSNWLAVLSAVGAAFAAGTDPAVAARDAIGGLLGASIAAALTAARTQITTTIAAVETDLRSLLQPTDPQHPLRVVRAQLTALLGADPLAPLDTALAGINLVAIAQPILNEIDAATAAAEIPAWLQTLLLLYVVAPFLVALGVVAAVIVPLLFAGLPLPFEGVVAAAVCSFIAVAGVQYLIALILRLLSGMLSLAGQIQAEVNRLVTRLRAIGADLLRSLAAVGTLQSAASALGALLADLDNAFPAEVNRALADAVLAARIALRDSLTTVVSALQLSFFRETLEVVEVLGALDVARPPQPPQNGTTHDPNLGYANRVAAALSRFEAERIRTLREPSQILTHVLSLRQLLPGTATQVLNSLQAVLTPAVVLTFDLGLEDLDRVMPGLHRQLIRDVQVQIDFALDAIPLPALGDPNVPLPGQPTSPLTGPGGETVTRADAVAAIVEESSALAGGESDPALDAAVPGGGFRGLPVTPGRLPTGIPAVITHDGTSTFRIKDAATIEAAAARGSSVVLGVSLAPDADPQLAQLGWHQLTVHEAPYDHVLSHFRVLEDGVRFFDPEKEINPLEFRSPAGRWTIEIPAIRHGLIQPQLPPIRDIRMIVSTVARYDPALAAAIDLPALPSTDVVEPDPRADDDLADLLADPLSGVRSALDNVANLISDLLEVTGEIPGLLTAIQSQLTDLVGQVASLEALGVDPTAALEDLRQQLDAALDDVVTQLSTQVAALQAAVTGGFDSLGDDLDALGDRLDEISALSATTAGLVSELTSGAPVVGGVRQLRVLSMTTDGLANETAVLAGTAPATFTIAADTLTARGITEPATVAWVVVTAITQTGSLLGDTVGGTPVTFPTAPGVLTFTPSGGAAQVANLAFTGPTVVIEGTDLGGGTAATSPVGTWQLALPAGMPPLSSAILAVFVESQ